MAANISELRPGVQSRFQDPALKLSQADVDTAIASAVAQYQRIRPRELTVKLDGDGGFDYAVALITGGTPTGAFVDGFSSILGVAYPYVSTDQQLSDLEPEDFGLVRLDTGLKLRFAVARPAATEDFLVLFTLPHTVNATHSTIRSSDDEAIKDLAAAICCEFLAALYSQETDGSIAADTVDRSGKSDSYRAQALLLRKQFDLKIEASGAQAAAFAVADIDRPGFGHRGHLDYLMHDRRVN
jgi:hypothetical protein